MTRAMREDLQRAWGVHAAVFYDRAPRCTFKSVELIVRFVGFLTCSIDANEIPLSREFSLNHKHELLLRLGLGTNGQVFGANPSEDGE